MRWLICILTVVSSLSATTYNCSSFALPPGNVVRAVNGINNAGTVTGYYTDAAGIEHAFVDNPTTGNFTSVDYPGGLPTILYAINNNGTSVGQSGNTVFTLDPAGNFHPIPVASGYLIRFVYGINDAGDISATVVAPDNSDIFAVVHPDGTVASYGGTHQTNEPPGSLNNSLQMVQNFGASGVIVNADGSIINIQYPNLPNLGNSTYSGNGLNNAGTFVGSINSGQRNFTRDASGNYSEVFCPGVSVIRNTFLPNAINDNGIIASVTTLATPVPGLAQTNITSSSVNFPPSTVGQPSSPQTLTISNGGNARLDIGVISITQSNSNPPVFGESGCVDTNTGTASLDPGSSCTLTLTATPNQAGQLTGTLYIEDSAPGSPHAVPLSVSGSSPAPPVCTVGATNPGPPASVSFTMQDTNSGLATISVTQTTNATANVQSFQPGTTAPVNASASQITPGQTSSIQFKVTNVAGSSTTCGSNFAAGSGGPAVWTGLGGSIVGRPSVASNSDGRLEVVALGSDAGIDDIAQSAPNGFWNGWTAVGGYLTGNPTIAANSNGVLQDFGKGGDSALWTTAQTSPGGPWSGAFGSLGGALISDAATAINSNGTLDVFVLGTDNGLWHNVQTSPGGSFSGWRGLGGSLSGLPSVVANQDGRLQVFARGTDHALWTAWQITPGGEWSSWTSPGGYLTSNPAAALNSSGTLQAFVIGSDTSLWTIAQSSAGNSSFTGWVNLGGSASGDPAVAVNQDGRLEAFVPGGDNALWHNFQTSAGSSTWSGWTSLQGAFVGTPAAIRALSGEVAVFVRAPDNTLWFISQTSPGAWN